MPKEPLLKINQNSVKKDFQKHLNDESNKRILFSARFGAGKSTFLKEYFEDHKEHYILLNLYPINYSISQNKDVFELIKYDLIHELLSKHPKLELQKEDYSFALLSQMFILHNLNVEPLLKSIITALKPGSKELLNVIEEVKSISNEYTDNSNKIVQDENKLLLSYIQKLKDFKGTEHEYDEISELITSLIDRLKAKSKKESVLIIDDLDRLDPEHIFRLFNVFSAHYDIVTQVNKFGFDKVIFVCDYENIKLMYEHRYGKGVDFSGYIDKFFSTDVFHYDNKKHVIDRLTEIFQSKEHDIPDQLLSAYSPKGGSFFYQAFEYLLVLFIDIKVLTLRNLDQFIVYNLPVHQFVAGKGKNNYAAKDFRFLILIHLLKKIFSISDLKTHLQNLSARFDRTSGNSVNIRRSAEIERYLIEDSLTFILNQNLIFSGEPVSENEGEKEFEFNDYIVKYSLHTERGMRMGLRYINLTSIISKTKDPIDQPNVFSFLIEALDKSESLAIH